MSAMKVAARYAMAVAMTAFAVLLTNALPGLLSPMRFFFFWCAVLITAVVAGSGPALVAVALSVFAAAYFLFAPFGSVIVQGADVVRLLLFASFAGGVSLAVAGRRAAVEGAAALGVRLRESELRYRTLVEAAPGPQAVWTATADGRIQWSDEWCAITGRTRYELESGDSMRIIHPDDRDRTWEKWTTSLREATLFVDEVRVRLADGRYRWFAIKGVPVKSWRGVTEWIGIIADIDDRKRHEQNAAFLNRASEVLASSLGYEKTMRSVARLCVPAVGDWCGIDIGDGADYERLVVEHADPARVELVRELDRFRPAPDVDPTVQAMRSGRSHLIEAIPDELLASLFPQKEQFELVRALGVRSSIIAPMIARGRTMGALTVVYGESGRRYSKQDVPFVEDIARRAAIALDNARLYEAAESANRAKDEFLATLSHELRTPMTAIAGWAHMLQLGMTDSATTKLAVDTILRSARTQTELIDDLLDLSRVVAGTLHLNIATVDVTNIVEDTIVAARPAADAKRLRIELLPAPSLLVRGDDRRLRQIVWNLISNAVKFTPPDGRVQIELVVRGAMAHINVTDTGQGIDPAFLPYVWDRFRQADSSTSRQHGGLGLGLAVVRHLVELHGGSVQVESAGVGRGATFSVALPLARGGEQLTTKPRSDRRDSGLLHGKRLLVVDDDDDARLVIAAMLRQGGAETVAAASIAEALELFGAAHFDAIVSDIAMPGEDGFALVRKLRVTSNVPIVAVSAIATGSDDRQHAIDAGFTEFIRKPVDPDELVRIVGNALAH
jgi:PAS domain S-box-containing protein